MDFMEQIKLMAVAQRVSEASSDFINEIIKIADEFQEDREEMLIKSVVTLQLALETGDFSEYIVEE